MSFITWAETNLGNIVYFDSFTEPIHCGLLMKRLDFTLLHEVAEKQSKEEYYWLYNKGDYVLVNKSAHPDDKLWEDFYNILNFIDRKRSLELDFTSKRKHRKLQ